MRTFYTILTAALILSLPNLAFGQVPSYEMRPIGGDPVSQIGSGEGAMVLMEDVVRQDTLSVWVQHVSVNRKPDYASAHSADRVVWCYPQIHHHPKHLFGDFSGKVAMFLTREGRVWFVALESGVADRIPTSAMGRSGNQLQSHQQ